MTEEYEEPTDEQLDKIKNWDTLNGWRGLVDFIESIWWMPDRGFKLYRGENILGVRITKLALHTGGWSGNESIIAALQDNIFWALFWTKSIAGGHYWFGFEKWAKPK